ncbi:MAG TPA: prepilin-type N-terminal cleavage/methylation domain-containing protein [Gemmatimonadaceae bacterium]|nr:prepilin-type N-terminal cleavage/methylation domain-containing protein [Gemmatimonadaceae bacterium]
MRPAFTIVELIVTICILGVLSAVAVPWAGDLLDRARVRGAVVEIESLFSGARHIAIARSTQATIDIDTVAQRISVSVGVDTLRRGEIGADHGVQLSASRVHMSYAATGMGYGAANLSVVVRRNASSDTVFVSRLGRLRH